MTKHEFSLIIPAAGSGRRMGHERNKLFITLAGRPVLWHTLRAFSSCPGLCEVILAVQSEDWAEVEALAGTAGLICPVRMVGGGETRQESVYNGLMAVNSESEWVWVHDGARPFVTRGTINRLLEAQRGGMNAVAAVPVKDTIKRAGRDGIVLETPERSGLWLIQTPQVFRTQELVEANRKALEDGYQGTDDASLMERAGKQVNVIEADYYNIKITTPEDLVLAEAILAHHKERNNADWNRL